MAVNVDYVSLKTSWVRSTRTKRARLTLGSPFRRKQPSITTHTCSGHLSSFSNIHGFRWNISASVHAINILSSFSHHETRKKCQSSSNLQEEDLICCEWCLAVELATTFSKRPHRLHPSSCHMTCTSCTKGSDVCCRPPAFP